MSKQQLTIEHIAPYLPYGVEGFWSDLNDDDPPIKVYIVGVTKTDGFGLQIVTYDSGGYGYSNFNEIKLILRTLSDLDKLDGGINSHSINLMLVKDFGLEYGVFSHYKNELTIDIDGDSSLGYDQNISIPFMVIEAVRVELLKGHYDIFGLIEKGLAININDLKYE